MASGNTLAVFGPLDNTPPTANNAAFAARNGHPVLAFDDTAQEAAIFSGVLPRHYAGGGITVYLHWTAKSATSDTIGWDVAFERMSDATTDLDADSFASAQTVTATTVPGTSGVMTVTSVAVSNGANMDSLAAGDSFRLRVRADVVNGTATGDRELHAIELKET